MNRISALKTVKSYEVKPGEEIVSVRNAVLLYHSELERETVLKDYLARRFPMSPDKYAVTVNPWGCGAFPQHTSPEFLVDEIRASAECNADYYQIDDSWQQGSGLGEMLTNRRTSMDFWAISRERMGGTFAPQLKAAAESGIRLALWTAPTMTTGFADWLEYAELLLKYHREYGFDLFKIDGVVMHSYESERNLEKILRFVSISIRPMVSVPDIFCFSNTATSFWKTVISATPGASDIIRIKLCVHSGN